MFCYLYSKILSSLLTYTFFLFLLIKQSSFLPFFPLSFYQITHFVFILIHVLFSLFIFFLSLYVFYELICFWPHISSRNFPFHLLPLLLFLIFFIFSFRFCLSFPPFSPRRLSSYFSDIFFLNLISCRISHFLLQNHLHFPSFSSPSSTGSPRLRMKTRTMIPSKKPPKMDTE